MIKLHRKLAFFLLAITLWMTFAMQAQALKQSPVFRQNPPAEDSYQAAVQDISLENQDFCCQKKYFWVAGAEIIALQVIPWYFNRHVADDTTAELSLNSFRKNINKGFEWDPNAFSGNMFQHPYHGNLFFNTARTNGYDFWGSVPFAFAGSFLWEMFGENNRPAINDWAMTSIGGINIGEALHRTAMLVRDNRSRGTSRALKEIAGFLLDPVGGFNRALRGEMSKVGPNPLDRRPSALFTNGTIGFRTVGENRLKNAAKSTAYGDLHLVYGDFFEDYKRPFDAFHLAVQVNGDEKVPVGILQVHGVLFGSELKNTDKVQHVFGLDMMYDYANNNTYETGGQSFAFSFRSRWNKSGRTRFETLLQPSIYVMTGIISEYVNVIDRDYDFGSGVGLRVQGIVGDAKGTYLVRAGYRGIFTHTVNGEKGNQIIHFAFVQSRYRIWRAFGIGAEYILFMRDSYFRDFPDIHKRNPEFRIGATFLW